MANTKFSLYGFLSDTAFYNREFADPGSMTADINQGACCVTDDVRNMFGTATILKDERDERLPISAFSLVGSEWENDNTGIKAAIMDAEGVLNGKMAIIVDKPNDAVTSALNAASVKDVFDFIEVAFNYQTFEDSEKRSIDDAALASLLDTFKEPAKISSYTLGPNVTDIARVYYPGIYSNRKVRNKVVVTFSPTDDVTIELTLWANRQEFIKDYPISTLTDVIFPCQCDKLYDLCTEYASLTDFATKVSNGKNSIFSITQNTYVDRDINDLLASDDHTGVYQFTTNYYANPDTPPVKTFELTFGVAYKGAVPSLDIVRDAIRTAILSVDSHSEEEWIKKLPGIVSGRVFYMIPLFNAEGNTVREGIVDITTIDSKIYGHLGSEVQAMSKYAQVLTHASLNYAVIVVPSPANPITTRLLSAVYPDFMGVPNTDADYGSQSNVTQDFSASLMAALANAYTNNGGTSISSDGIPADKKFVSFTSSDGINYNVLTRASVVGS